MCTLLYVGTRPSILCQIESEQSGGHTTSHASSGLTVLLARGWSLKAQCLEPEGQTEGIANGNIANCNITDGQMGFHRRPLIFTYKESLVSMEIFKGAFHYITGKPKQGPSACVACRCSHSFTLGRT